MIRERFILNLVNDLLSIKSETEYEVKKKQKEEGEKEEDKVKEKKDDIKGEEVQLEREQDDVEEDNIDKKEINEDKKIIPEDLKENRKAGSEDGKGPIAKENDKRNVWEKVWIDAWNMELKRRETLRLFNKGKSEVRFYIDC